MVEESRIRGIQIFFLVSIGSLSPIIFGTVVAFYIQNYIFSFVPIFCLIFGIPFFLTAFFMGFVIDRIKKKQVYFLSYILFGISLLLLLLTGGTLHLVALLFMIIGILSGINIVFGISYANSYLQLHKRGSSFGIIMGAGVLFWGITSALWILDRTGYYAVYLLSAANIITGAICIILKRFLDRDIIFQNPTKIPKYINIKSNFVIYSIGIFVFGLFLGFYLYISSTMDAEISNLIQDLFYFENFQEFLDWSALLNLPFHVFLFTLAGIIIPIVCMVFGKLMDKYGRKPFFFLACILISADLTLLIFVPENFIFLISIAASLAIIVGVFFLINHVVWADLAHENKLAKYVGFGTGSLILGTYSGFGITYGILYLRHLELLGMQPTNVVDISYIISLFTYLIIVLSLVPFIFMKETLPPQEELNWQDKIINIHILHKGGVIMLYYSFDIQEESNQMKGECDPTLFSGGITGITTLLQEMVESKEKLEYIDHHDKKLMFEYGDDIVAVLQTKKVLKILKNKLKQLTNDIMEIFGDFIDDWKGDLNECKAFRPLIVKYFLND